MQRNCRKLSFQFSDPSKSFKFFYSTLHLGNRSWRRLYSQLMKIILWYVILMHAFCCGIVLKCCYLLIFVHVYDWAGVTRYLHFCIYQKYFAVILYPGSCKVIIINNTLTYNLLLSHQRWELQWVSTNQTDVILFSWPITGQEIDSSLNLDYFFRLSMGETRMPAVKWGVESCSPVLQVMIITNNIRIVFIYKPFTLPDFPQHPPIQSKNQA